MAEFTGSRDLDQFDISTGLDGARSDWLIGARVVTPAGLSLTQRVLLDDDLSSTEAELRFGWFSEDLSISSGYYWNIADPDAGQTDQISEWSVDGSWRMADNWTGRLGLRQDFIAGARRARTRARVPERVHPGRSFPLALVRGLD